MTLIEVMIVMVIMAMVAVAAAFAVMPVLARARVRQATTDVATVRQAATAYQVEIGGCPSVDDLVREQILSSHTNTVDPWGNAFVIECEDDGREPGVTSAGPDGEHGNEDDIR
jgi:prepilin-type N-terminal cleavage/methylation domain-containing protein